MACDLSVWAVTDNELFNDASRLELELGDAVLFGPSAAAFGSAAVGPFPVGLCALGLEVATGGLQTLFREPSFLAFKLHVFLAGMFLATLIRQKIWNARSATLLAGSMMLVGWEARLRMPIYLAIFLCLGSQTRGSWFPALVARVLGSGPARWLGDVSYGVYLVHGWVIALIGSRLMTAEVLTSVSRSSQVLLLTLVTIGETLPLAWLLFIVTERPCIRLGRRLVG